MILKGSTTNSIAHAGRLANHLLNKKDNDEVRLIEITGQQTEDAKQAMLFMHGAATLTNGHKGCFQVSINPEVGEEMTPEQWEDAVARIEQEFGFTGQPRVIVEHIKQGRQHRHIVWQRTNYETETLVPIDFFRIRLKAQAREMELAYDHKPVNDYRVGPKFDQAAHRQAKRNGDRDPRERSAFIRKTWEEAKTPDEFVHFLREGGYELAQGKRFVLLDRESGEILRGALGRHLKCPDKGIVKVAELRTWAEGLSTPLESVEVVQAKLKADKEPYDRDAYHEAWLRGVEEEAIRQAKAEDAEKKKRRSGKQKSTGKAAGGKMPQPRKDFRKPADGYRSYAEEMDPLIEWERDAQRQRNILDNKLESVYRLKAKAADLARLKAELAKYTGIKGAILSGDKALLEEKIEARQKTLENAQWRADGYRNGLETRLYASKPEIQAQPANDPAQAPASTREQEIQAIKERLQQERAQRQADRGQQRGPRGPRM